MQKKTLPPAEKIAISGRSDTAVAMLIQAYFFPLKVISFPIERSEATAKNSVTGNFCSSNTYKYSYN